MFLVVLYPYANLYLTHWQFQLRSVCVHKSNSLTTLKELESEEEGVAWDSDSHKASLRGGTRLLAGVVLFKAFLQLY